MGNIIPGADILGFGFNSLGTYGIESATSQLFARQTNDAESWTYPPTQTQYDIPDNIAVLDDTKASGQSYVFSNEQAFQSHYASELHAGISTEFGTFKGSFDAAYSSDVTRTGSHYYGVYEANFNGWDLSLVDESHGRLAPAFLQDPDVQALLKESHFNPQNAFLFFRVFNKFGTHFVSQVKVGGKLYYYLVVDTSYSSDSTHVSASISLEYKAVFADTSVEASMDWQKLSQEWTNSRKVSIDARGGDTGPLSALDPTYGTNFHDVFTHWQSAVMQNPAVIEYKLRPLSVLFSGNLADAIGQALKAYANAGISVMAEYQTGSTGGDEGHVVRLATQVMLNSQPVVPQMPEPPAPYPGQGLPDKPVGLQLAIVDSNSLALLLNKFYYMDAYLLPDCMQVYETMYADISRVTKPGCIIALAAMGVPFYAFPQGSFYYWLQSCGATLQQWETAFNQGETDPGVFQMASYVCVGQQGGVGGSAYEAYIDELTTGWVKGTNPPGIARVLAWLQPPVGEGDGYSVNAGSSAMALVAGGDR